MYVTNRLAITAVWVSAQGAQKYVKYRNCTERGGRKKCIGVSYVYGRTIPNVELQGAMSEHTQSYIDICGGAG
jgi:hypothetical protein